MGKEDKIEDGFVIVVENTAMASAWAYHFIESEEAKAKQTFAKLVAQKMTESGHDTAPADVCAWLKSGGFRFPGMKNSWRIVHDAWVFTFLPTIAVPA